MMTKTIDIHTANIRIEDLLSLIRQGTEVMMTEADIPLARISPCFPPPQERVAGLHSEAIWTSDDFDEPLPDEFWMGHP
jgi:antitoxin (DNA-binding transcriptional repressor) of toxin-antitoxin stability system